MIVDCIELVKRFEGFSSKPYLCPAGVWTIGYGTTRYPNGRRVKATDESCTVEQADSWLIHELCKCEGLVLRNTRAELNNRQLAALTSFVYNLGIGAFRASTLRRRIDSGNFDDVPRQLSRWVYAGGRRLPGLVLRRAAEAELWQTGV